MPELDVAEFLRLSIAALFGGLLTWGTLFLRIRKLEIQRAEFRLDALRKIGEMCEDGLITEGDKEIVQRVLLNTLMDDPIYFLHVQEGRDYHLDEKVQGPLGLRRWERAHFSAKDKKGK